MQNTTSISGWFRVALFQEANQTNTTDGWYWLLPDGSKHWPDQIYWSLPTGDPDDQPATRYVEDNEQDSGMTRYVSQGQLHDVANSAAFKALCMFKSSRAFLL